MQKVLRTFVLVIGLAGATAADAQTRVEKNVIYGMYSGLALLMDVHYPAQPNGYGIVFVSGSGWQAPLNYGAVGLKEAQIPLWGPPLLRAGYTVFAINHRAAPRFHYPAAVDDVQRAVRFVRHHARQYGIDSRPAWAPLSPSWNGSPTARRMTRRSIGRRRPSLMCRPRPRRSCCCTAIRTTPFLTSSPSRNASFTSW
jgi:hypothetical protein